MLASFGKYEVYYAPFGGLPPQTTRIMFVGLTPGYSQMELAARTFMECSRELRRDPDLFAELLRSRVAFAGSMRANLCSMLDDLGLPETYGIKQSAELFEPGRSDVGTTSALLFPVLKNPGLTNFSGQRELGKTPIFREMLEGLLAPQLESARTALVVPLGVAASSGLRHLHEIGRLSSERVLWGMPHPSGSNGHRQREFRENEAAMRRKLRTFFSA